MYRWSHVYIILKKLNKSIPWFIHIDLISDLIDDLINLIKSMPTLGTFDRKKLEERWNFGDTSLSTLSPRIPCECSSLEGGIQDGRQMNGE